MSEVNVGIDEEYRYYDPESVTTFVESSHISSGNSFLAGIHANGGLIFGKRFSIGAGIGVERYTYPSITTVPLYLNMRMNLLRKLPVFVYADFGYMLSIRREYTFNSFVSSGVGTKLFSFENLAINGVLSFDLREFQFPDSNNQLYSKRVVLNGLNIGFQVSFLR